MRQIEFTDTKGSFQLRSAQQYPGLYFPIAGECGLKSALTPELGGDAKLDQNHFLLEPASMGNLNATNGSRNFWCVLEDGRLWSVTGHSPLQEVLRFTEEEEDVTVSAGYMWHTVTRHGTEVALKARVTSFIPYQKNMEIHRIEITNTGKEPLTFRPAAAIPIYGRSADNIRDHRHVTSLLHRVTVTEGGVQVCPTFSFDERGHQLNREIYFVNGMTGDGRLPESFEPELAEFAGSGSLSHPEALLRGSEGRQPSYQVNGQEALGGLYFAMQTLQPGEETSYLLFLGAAHSTEEISMMLADYTSGESVQKELERTRQYWENKVNISLHTGNERFDQFMNWVNFQPELRRIYGCSFLPHHDYGKGGRGWRDLWQDCLALLLMNPGGVRQMLLGNFSGVRIDGSNATIIGEHIGEFKADRNSIPRMWMDHGMWPYLTTRLYIDQTGDLEILNQQIGYFKDCHVLRCQGQDLQWEEGEYRQKDTKGRDYTGTVLEHLLLQHLTAFWEVGEHNHIRLRNADWNDALDMAPNRGESVAFSGAYAGNLLGLADLIEELRNRGHEEFRFLQEMEILFTEDGELYDNVTAKQQLLQQYLEKSTHEVSGNIICVDAGELAENLRRKGQWMQEHIRKTEWIADGEEKGWFNGYYDDHGRALEGIRDSGADMMLTSQVFTIMNAVATKDQTEKIIRSAREHLYDASCGGYRLNTDFGEIRTDMGRMFGFAYGEKENGAVFSHMAVMYANALYTRGFAREGYEALQALYRQSMDLEKGGIYPGIPEYFGHGGRGLYHYLTGAASWYMLTVVTKVFGVRGSYGDLLVSPMLVKEQFSEEGLAMIQLKFEGKNLQIQYVNADRLDYGEYHIQSVQTGENIAYIPEGDTLRIPAAQIAGLSECGMHRVVITLGK